ncbi:hypothetical protein [Paenibacillus odorifer]|uniref:hypothetical protein n=1 Tax=Paenibacillus odorifer TaxID=189426 RepID=UPI00096FE792|nr:hypothetical protein [Paenibacillus odorifer]OMD08375.1 hypothetical protein BJP50_07230 [Paenibacillus odorifer]
MGNNTETYEYAKPEHIVGKTIKSVVINDQMVEIVFSDGDEFMSYIRLAGYEGATLDNTFWPKSTEPLCNYCDDTGYIGSPLEFNCTPCTDCDIWSDNVKHIKGDSQAEGHLSTESAQAQAGGRKESGGSYE